MHLVGSALFRAVVHNSFCVLVGRLVIASFDMVSCSALEARLSVELSETPSMPIATGYYKNDPLWPFLLFLPFLLLISTGVQCLVFDRRSRFSILSVFIFPVVHYYTTATPKAATHTYTTVNNERQKGCRLSRPAAWDDAGLCPQSDVTDSRSGQGTTGWNGRMGRMDGKECAYDIRSFRSSRGNGRVCIEKNGMAWN